MLATVVGTAMSAISSPLTGGTGGLTLASEARAMSCCVPFSNQRTCAITVYAPSSSCSELVRVERNAPSASSSNSPVTAEVRHTAGTQGEVTVRIHLSNSS